MMKLWHYVLIILIGVLGGQTRDILADTNFTNGLLAFVSDRDGNYEIYSIAPDGSDLRNLTNDPASDLYPVWSSDGTQILFASDRHNERYDLFVMEADGSNPHRITKGLALEEFSSHAWSPDGTQILAVAAQEPMGLEAEDYDLYVMEADGSNLRNLSNPSRSELFPAWSPDGSQIVFALGQFYDSGIIADVYVIDPYGENLRQLTDTPEDFELFPTWSADGDTIAFSALYENDEIIYIMNADGSELHSVTEGGSAFYPVWSPDDHYLAFVFNPNPDDETSGYDLYVLDIANTELHQITHGEVDIAFAPIWSPDGQFLAVFVNDSSQSDLHIVAADGTHIEKITFDALDSGSETPIEFSFSTLVSWQSIR